MKLVIQIPCFNEEGSLPATLAALPRAVKGFETVEWLVIDDGSTDGTVAVARRLGVDHIVSFARNRGLARAFMAGLEAALKVGADVIVNTDGDNQYDAACIPDLVRPILERRALLVVGARPISEIEHFSPAKKALQRLGSWAVRKASGADIPDAPSGFRAIHREAALRLYAFGAYTYTLETIIQAGRIGLPIASVDIRVNGDLRPSRLVPSVFGYVWRSTITILRVFVLYKPLRFFLMLAALVAAPGLLGLGRFLFLWSTGEGEGHIQSVVISSGLIAMAAAILIGGILSDLVAANRVLLEDIRSRLLRREVDEMASDEASQQTVAGAERRTRD